ncbi:hypothetical protein ACOTJB_23840 [Achromobacter xylosoxidans]
MTQQDDITQRVLTDDEIMRSAISACDSLNITRFHEIGAPSKTIMDDAGLLELGRAIESALLSKLRAPVADERLGAQEYGSPADVAQRIEQYLAQDGRMNSGTQLLYEAMKALRASQGDRNDG